MEFIAAVESYLRASEAAGRAERTLSFHRQNLTSFYSWLVDAHITGADWCSPPVLDEYLTSQRHRGFAPSTIQARYRTLRAFLRWLIRRRLLASDPMAGMTTPSAPVVRKTGVPRGDLARIVQAIPDGHWTAHRDRLILSLLSASGLRVGELTSLTVHHIDVSDRLIRLDRTKSRRARTTPLSVESASLLTQYLMTRPAADNTLLVRAHRPHTALTPAGVRHILRVRCSAAGVHAWSPHAFRRGYAQRLLDGGMPLELVAELLGHASVDVTRAAYADWRATDLRAAYDRAWR